MKKVWVFFVGFIMLVSGALANQPAMVKFGNDERWKVFEAELVAHGHMKPGDTSFDTKAITAVMMNGYPREVQEAVGFDRLHAMNLEQNKIGQRIEVAQFRKMAASGKFLLPKVDTKVSTPDKGGVAPAETPVAADQAAIGTAIKEGREALASMPPGPEVERLRQELTALATQKASAVFVAELKPVAQQVTAVKAEIKALTLRIKVVEDGVTAINRRLNDSETGLAMAHTKADAAHNRLDDKVNGLAAAHAKADKVWAAITNSETGINALNERMEAVEKDQGDMVQWMAIGAVALLALAALLRTFLSKGGKEKVKTVPVSEAMAPGMVDDPLDFGQAPRVAKSVMPGGKSFEPASAV